MFKCNDRYTDVIAKVSLQKTRNIWALKLMNLMMEAVTDSEGIPTRVRPAKNVKLFTTIGGVELVNPDQDLSEKVCLTPGGMNSLQNLLQGFVNMGGEVVVCPLCAMTRDITQPTHG